MPTRSLQARNELHCHVILSNAARVLICDFVSYDDIVGMRPATLLRARSIAAVTEQTIS
jgi:hypothetical protein